jgi:rifampicin phosphotransferase
MSYFLNLHSSLDKLSNIGGGKAYNLFRMANANIPVPEFLVVSDEFLRAYKKNIDFDSLVKNIQDSIDRSTHYQNIFNENPIPVELLNNLEEELKQQGLLGQDLAVRSSGLDEDSKDHSFAGMFSSFLYQKEMKDIEVSIRKCWASAFSVRCLEYRVANKLKSDDIGMGVVIQKMVQSDISGVLFSRNPISQIDYQSMIIESVYGQCEGLVSGLLEADNFVINRDTFEYTMTIADKLEKFQRSATGNGIEKVTVKSDLVKSQSLNQNQLNELVEMGKNIEQWFESPMDIEWAFEGEKLYVVQMRPITTLPGLNFYNHKINGGEATLWDNSNIVESFAGVTTPLTFSLTKEAYAVVYQVTSRVVGVPENIIDQFLGTYENMLGLVRGRVYYNLVNWYKLLLIIPGFSSNQGFMETMMGVKEELTPSQQELFKFLNQAPKYGACARFKVMFGLVWKFITIKRVTKDFTENFNNLYSEYFRIDFNQKSLRELKSLYERWTNNITYQWKAPIINDFLVMVSFGTLKKLTEKWVKSKTPNLQNDLLCGQGEIDSTLPTITLMKLAKKYDSDLEVKNILNEYSNDELINLVRTQHEHVLSKDISEYLRLYGFRCNNEQKLEEDDLHDNPAFIFDSLKNYLRSKKYDVSKMHQNEIELRRNAEEEVDNKLFGVKRALFYWVLNVARFAVRNRENLRFLRSKSFGISRRLFKSMVNKLSEMQLIDSPEDGFYLTYREIFDFIEGKSESLSLDKLATIRKEEFEQYLLEDDPPDRFITYGSAGASLMRKEMVDSGDLLKNKIKISDDPNLIYGVSCCSGVVKGKVLFAKTLEDASEMNNEILVTKRTDPGWVPLFPNCKGIIVERGSLLSHSAVIARELGIPTIVGVPGGLIKKLESGMEIELNAGAGEIRILS